MATRLFSTLLGGSTIAFDPSADILRFDDSVLTASDVRVDYAADGTGVSFQALGKKIFLSPALSVTSLSSEHVVFANGSMLIIGDNSLANNDAAANTLTGTIFGDQLAGLGGADLLLGGLGTDRLDGGGGADTMKGCLGADTYIVDDVGDVVSEEPVLVSSDAAGVQANSSSFHASFSADGRYVVFDSYASNLVAGDTNGGSDIFVKDLQTGAIQRVSTDSTGAQANNWSFGASFSANGRYVLFESDASNLVADDTNYQRDVFVKDLQTGAILRVSTDSTGVQANGLSDDASLSADGRYVLFESSASNLVVGDTNSNPDIFVKDRTGAIQRVSTDSSGAQANSSSHDASFSADGRYVLFESDASNLVAGDTNNQRDLFVKDLQTGTIQRVSTDSTGAQANSTSYDASFSADGRYVLFESYASNLVAGDTNGDADIFLKDLQTGAIQRVSTDSGGANIFPPPTNTWSHDVHASLSGDGRYVLFTGYYGFSRQEFPWDLGGYVAKTNLFIKDLQTGALQALLPDHDYLENLYAPRASFSADGRSVVFHTNLYGLLDGQAYSQDNVFVLANPFLDPDTVRSSVSYTLPDRVENLVLTGAENIDATGNALANMLTGNDGNNLLDGGSGADVMRGGMGSDTYVVDNAGDVVEETSSFSLDPVRQVSTAVNGAPADGSSYNASFSADGHYVVFQSNASNLVAGDTNGRTDIFVKDLQTGAIQRVSTDSTGAQANSGSSSASFSADGRYVVFRSDASNLVAGDTNGQTDVFVKDLQSGAIQRVSTDSTWAQANSDSSSASFSADGRYVVFESDASNLVAGDANGQTDVFVKDLQSGVIQRVSTDSTGAQANSWSDDASFSANGRYVLFESYASNLVAGDTNGAKDVFVKDLQTGAIQRVSTDSTGAQLYEHSLNASFSSDGRQVVFTSYSYQQYEEDPWSGGMIVEHTSSNIHIKNLDTGALESLFPADAEVETGENVPRASFSADGRYLLFDTYANGLVHGDQDDDWDVFVKDLQTGAVRRVAENAIGYSTGSPRFSSDGLYVVFDSYANDLVEDPASDWNDDVFGAPNPFVVVSGTDTVRSSLSYTLTANVENLILTGNQYHHINGTGNALANALTGNDGNNVLDGGAGADKLAGGGGNDTYYVDDPGDRVVESLAGGTDQVLASCRFTLSAHVENLTLTGSADIDGTGNPLANVLLGNSGANVLDGGSGHDTVSGGDGADRLLGGEGNDTLSGDSGADQLLGGSGNDTLDGGSGADTIEGGPGNDLYLVDNSGDVISEALTPDPVRISVTDTGVQGNGYDGTPGSSNASFSADGRYVVFQSYAGNLVDGDNTWTWDIFVKDLQTGAIQRVSTDSTGAQANSESTNASFSTDGRYVLFESSASNLVAGDTNYRTDVFVKNLQSGAIQRVSTDSTGAQANSDSSSASFSADGHYLLFASQASNLVLDDSNGASDVFVKDLLTGEVRNLSSDAAGVQGNGPSGGASFSTDGRYLVFQSDASNLVALDGNSASDVFLKDLLTDDVQLISSDAAGTVGNGGSGNASISADGNRVVFESSASNLVADDSNGNSDVFVKDLRTGAVERLSTDAAGNQGNGGSGSASLSQDGRYLVFASEASNLVANDSNGRSDVFVKDLQTGAILRVSTSVAGVEGDAGSFSPRFSSDGRYIVLASDASNLVANDTNRQMDVFRVLNPFVEAGGSDTVRSSVSYVLPDRVEKIVLTGNGHLNATGNAQDNVLTGNAGNNLLDGGGGADTLSGGAGNDRYVVDNAGDSVIEYLGNGTDTVLASISYRLVAHVEGLTLTGTADLAGTGNSLNNLLTGNDGANLLDGGAGADTMAGGRGDDSYVVDSVGDVVEEAANGGSDTVQSTLNFSLATLANVEHLTLLGLGNLSATGNAGDNVLTGNVGDNQIDGGDGSDTASYVNAAAAVEVNLAISEAQNTGFGDDTLVNIENLTGSRYDDTLIGNEQNNVLDGGPGLDLLIGQDGDDTYVVDSAADRVIEAAGEGVDAVYSTVSLALADHVEQLTLTGQANLAGYGNSLNNRLVGNQGSNLLNGGAGADTMLGGDGSDSYYVDDSGDVVSETNASASTGGTDLVCSRLSAYTLTSHVENGRILAGGAASLTGNGLNNVLYAGGGDNVLDGGTGSDTASYAYASSGVNVSLVSGAQTTGGSGSDTLLSIENLAGSKYDDRLTGNSEANTLNGGVGADTMTGGNGSDTYYVDNAGDLVSETNATVSSGGTDLVQSYLAAYTLGANVENGRILATSAASLTGNDLNNVLYAGVGNNVLDGGTGSDTASYAYASSGVNVTLASGAQTTGGSGSDTLVSIESLAGSKYDDHLTGNSEANTLNGGAGADTMSGGDGSDTYYVDHAGDIVSEVNATASGGTDLVQSYLAAYTLGANVENGRILAGGAANLTGNSLNNSLYAGVGNNVLDGGAGSDTVSYAYGVSGSTGVTANLVTGTASGGSGSDSFFGIENLTGSGNDDTLFGNALANLLNGGAGNDLLAGGLGNDTLTGGVGADFFRFDTLPNASTNRDRISDFVVADDTIQLENAVFASLLNTGALAADSFRSGNGATSAADADDYLIYNSSSGALYYDAGGNLGVGPVQIATLGSGLALTSLDLIVT